MYILDLEKAEEIEIKLPTSTGSQGKQGKENIKKTSISASLTMLKPFDRVNHNKWWKILKEMEIPHHLTPNS